MNFKVIAPSPAWWSWYAGIEDKLDKILNEVPYELRREMGWVIDSNDVLEL